MNVGEKVDFLNSLMEDAVSQVFENLLDRKKTKRKRIPKDIRSLYKKKSSLSKKIFKTKCKEKLGRLIVDLETVELELRSKKEASRRKEEDEVIEQIKVNPKVFYSYARRKTGIRTKIGPLLVNGQTISGEKEMADILSAQYEGVCSSPRKDINSEQT